MSNADIDLTFDPSCMDDYDPNSLPVEAALSIIQSTVNPLRGTECVALRQSLGRILAEDIRSPIDVPSHRNSAMDGYALAGADLQDAAGSDAVTLRVAGTSWAGKPHREELARGTCVRIMTGGVVPEGADTVVMQERVKASDDQIVFATDAVKAGENVRQAGEDLTSGTVILERGCRIGPTELGLLASVGIVEVSVKRRLRVAFFSTGDELRSLGQPLDVGCIYDSNRYTLYGMLSTLGADIIDMGVVVDDPVAVEAAFEQASGLADVVITSGGVSVGDADYVKETLDKLGSVSFWKIAMKPGRPLAFGTLGNALFFGLPGNPVSVMVTFTQFVQRAIRTLMGERIQAAPTLRARCASRLKKRPGRMEFQRGVLSQDANGELRVASTGDQGSGILSSMHEANCFIILPLENGGVEAGELVEVEPFSPMV